MHMYHGQLTLTWTRTMDSSLQHGHVPWKLTLTWTCTMHNAFKHGKLYHCHLAVTWACTMDQGYCTVDKNHVLTSRGPWCLLTTCQQCVTMTFLHHPASQHLFHPYCVVWHWANTEIAHFHHLVKKKKKRFHPKHAIMYYGHTRDKNVPRHPMQAHKGLESWQIKLLKCILKASITIKRESWICLYFLPQTGSQSATTN